MMLNGHQTHRQVTESRGRSTGNPVVPACVSAHHCSTSGRAAEWPAQCPRVWNKAYPQQSQLASRGAKAQAARTVYPPLEEVQKLPIEAPTGIEYDAVIIGGGMGGLATASQLVAKGAKVVVLEKYLVPGGSAAHFKREGFTFDVGSSMMFGMGSKGTTNLITKCLEAVGKAIDTVPDPSQVHYHLPASSAHPEGLSIKVWRAYDDFVEEMGLRFPHEKEGVKKFYDDCWKVFNSLNVLELKSLEEPRYLLTQFARQPLACLTLAAYATSNTGDIARRYIKDPVLLKFIDLECFIWSTVSADMTPMINAGMVFCDRHFGGINYPVGGVGRLAELLVDGITERGSHIVYKANVKEILTHAAAGEAAPRAVGVRLADGREFRGKTVVSNATRWDTFDKLLGEDKVPESEKLFKQRYKKAPSFFSMHMGVKAEVFAARPGRAAVGDCHHIILEDWARMEDTHGTLFVSLPSVLDPSLAPAGQHIVHAFTPDWIEDWQGLDVSAYEARKQQVADQLVQRLDAVFPGLAASVTYMEAGTPRTHRRYLNREDGTYGPIPSRRPLGMLSMPLNRTAVPGLYCVGDSTFPGQGVNAVVFSGFGCAHRIACDTGREPSWPLLDRAFNATLDYVRDRS
ncbi:carotenoid isomerase [Haematococcus lacustris]